MGASNHLLDFDTSLFSHFEPPAPAALFFVARPIFLGRVLWRMHQESGASHP
jgi:hypothetical protein